MATLEAALSLFSSSYPSSSVHPLRLKPTILHFPHFTPTLSVKLPITLSSPKTSSKLRRFEVCTAVQEVQEIEEEKEDEEIKETGQKRKLYVVNLPWSFTVADIKNLFSECGAAIDVDIIKQKGGKSRGYAFVTMASGDEAQLVVKKFDGHEVLGRTIKVEFAKRFKKPTPLPRTGPSPGETHHRLYVSNLAWKVRSNDLRELFSANFSPTSARVIFNTPSGRSAGYGFVSFATREEAESAMSDLNGKELLGRPITLKFSLKSTGESENEQSEEESTSEGQLEESSFKTN